MQSIKPLKIIIEGDFWDCQIYRGYLYIWHMNGSLLTLDWNKLVDFFLENNNDNIGVKFSFLDSDHLYRRRDSETQKTDFDEEFKNSIKLINSPFIVSKEMMKDFIVNVQDNPFKELPTDTEIHYDQIFGATDYGLLKVLINIDKQSSVSSESSRIFDCPILSIKASKKRLALSAGDEGLFEVNLNENNKSINYFSNDEYSPTVIEENINKLSSKHSSFSNWNFSSIYSSSYIDTSYLVAFDWKSQSNASRNLNFKGSILDTEIFKINDTTSKHTLSWGMQERIYKIDNGRLNIVKFKQKNIGDKIYKSNFSLQDPFELDKNDISIVSAGVSLFGVIVEFEKAFFVIQSNGFSYEISESITRWRVYPRSKRYLNHLHIIYEDRLEVYSFNHDYFVRQQEKKLGVKYNKDFFDMDDTETLK